MKSYKITGAAADDDIPIAFESVATSKINGSTPVPAGSGVFVLNETESLIALSIVGTGDDVPSSTFPSNQFVVPAGLGKGVFIDVFVSNNADIYLRSESGSAIVAGSVYITVYDGPR